MVNTFFTCLYTHIYNISMLNHKSVNCLDPGPCHSNNDAHLCTPNPASPLFTQGEYSVEVQQTWRKPGWGGGGGTESFIWDVLLQDPVINRGYCYYSTVIHCVLIIRIKLLCRQSTPLSRFVSDCSIRCPVHPYKYICIPVLNIFLF